MIARASARFFCMSGSYPGSVFRTSSGIPHSPSGKGCMTPPISPWPSLMMSIKARRSMLSAIARRISGSLKGGLSRLIIRLRLMPPGHFANRRGRPARDVLHQRDRGCDPIGLPSDEGQVRGRHVADDRELDAVEIGPPALPVIRVAGQRDPLVRLKLDKSKGSGADGMLPHLGRSNMARIDHRITRGQQHDKGRLRPFQTEGDLVVAVGRYFGEVAVPRLARIDPQLVVRFAEQQDDRHEAPRARARRVERITLNTRSSPRGSIP